jgi:hypothetical protein
VQKKTKGRGEIGRKKGGRGRYKATEITDMEDLLNGHRARLFLVKDFDCNNAFLLRISFVLIVSIAAIFNSL